MLHNTKNPSPPPDCGQISVRERLSQLLAAAWAQAARQGAVPSGIELPPIIIEHPRQAEHGDFASSLA
jgi:hypothetical protein